MWYAFIGDLKKIVPAQLLPKYDTAFAITIHQSQGSGFRDVAIFMPTLSAGSDAPLYARANFFIPALLARKKRARFSGLRMP